MQQNPAIFTSNLRSVAFINRGKVRDIYAVDTSRLLIVTTDRLSAFDVILPDPIPGKGQILTRVSRFWFPKLQHIVPNHIDTTPLDQFLQSDEIEYLDGRGMLVRKFKPLPVEAVVRGYLSGSGWSDYRKTGSLCGIPLPKGLSLAEKLPEPLFTPASKADSGEHDENISFITLSNSIGGEYAHQIKEISLRLYNEAAQYAASRGIIIADTKFEFGIDNDGKIHLIDEALTPDSSRFWPADQYKPGINPPSFDKQFVRDYLETLDWNKQAPGPKLPDHIIQQTAEKYQLALEKLTR